MKFEKFHLSEDLLRNLNSNGFFRTTDIQFKAIPSILKGEDVLAIAQTGTGKTAAFAIPIINTIHSNKSSKRSLGVKCLVMVPTRELARQIGEVFNSLSKHTKVKPFAVYGGIEQDAQVEKLQSGLDVVIATPGRMFDLIRHNHLDLSHVETLVLDEADRMLELGFRGDVQMVKSHLKRRHQTLFFSATINPEIKKLAYSQVNQNAIRIQISPEDPISKNITHAVVFVEMDDKRYFLAEYIHQNPDEKIIIFVRTRVRAERVAKAMGRVNISTLTIHGEKDQLDREQVMATFRSGKEKILIATDVSARGIDIADVSHVINYDLPEKPENYVHRIGRTGRGFNKGQAVSFCASEERAQLDAIEKLIGKKIEKIRVTEAQRELITEPLEEVTKSMSISEMIEAEEAAAKARKRQKNKNK